MLGALLGYGSLYVVDFLFYQLTGKQGMGEGDFELFAFIGSFIGPIGCWFTITAGSTIGALFISQCCLVYSFILLLYS